MTRNITEDQFAELKETLQIDAINLYKSAQLVFRYSGEYYDEKVKTQRQELLDDIKDNISSKSVAATVLTFSSMIVLLTSLEKEDVDDVNHERSYA
jgi:hypothetical protein